MRPSISVAATAPPRLRVSRRSSAETERRRGRRVPRSLAFAALTLLASCKLDEVAIPRTEPQLALHGVLSATASTQTVLLERTRSGRVNIVAPPFDLGDPVVSDEGIAETDATVLLVRPEGDTVAAVEDKLTRFDGKGQGIYRFGIAGVFLQRGAPYRLLVRTTKGETMSAETTLPAGDAAVAAGRDTMNRERDTLAYAWPRAAGARAYFVRVETPYGPRAFFTQDTTVRLPGMLRNVDVSDLPHVFLPGFAQAVTVSAVDSNFYDWYRSHSDLLSGEGLIDRVVGGWGVFGSLVRLRFDSVEVRAPQTRPIEGHFQFAGGAIEAAALRYSSFDLWVESPAARGGQSDALSGRYAAVPRIDYFGCRTCGLLGTVRGTTVEIALLKDWSGADTVEVFDAQLRGDTLVGTYRFGGGPFHYVRTP